VLYTPDGTTCGGIAGSSANAAGNVTLAPPATGVALTITGAPDGSDGLDITGNFMNNAGVSITNTSAGDTSAYALDVTSSGITAMAVYDNTTASSAVAMNTNAVITDSTGIGQFANALEGSAALEGANVTGDTAMGDNPNASDVSSGGAAALVVGMLTNTACTSRTMLCYGAEISAPSTSFGVTSAGLEIDSQSGHTAIDTDSGDPSFLGPLTAQTLTVTAHAKLAGVQTTGTIANSLCTDASGNVIANASVNCFTSGAGTVTSFSAGNLSPLFTTSVATSTTTPALTFALSNAAAGTVLGNATGSAAGPTYTSTPVLGVSGTAGTVALFSASGNFTTTLGSAATASNTVNFFATAPTTGDLVDCVTSSTTCTLTDSGVLAANVTTNAVNYPSNSVTYATGNHTQAGSANLTWVSPTLTIGASGTAGSLTEFNNTASTTWASGATTSNTITGFATAPVTGELVSLPSPTM
jgi:hypothetical protein